MSHYICGHSFVRRLDRYNLQVYGHPLTTSRGDIVRFIGISGGRVNSLWRHLDRMQMDPGSKTLNKESPVAVGQWKNTAEDLSRYHRMMELRIGCKLKIFSVSGVVYEGILCAVDLKGTGDDDRISLKQCVCIDTGRILPGIFHFLKTDIKKFEILAPAKNENIKLGKRNGAKLMEICSKVTPAHLKRIQNVDSDKLSYAWRLGTDKLKETRLDEEDPDVNKPSIPETNDSIESGVDNSGEGKLKEEGEGELLVELLGDKENNDKTSSDQMLPSVEKPESNVTSEPEYVVFDEIDDSFHEMIEVVKTQRFIGLAMQGIKIGRLGELCYLQIHVSAYRPFLFDILALKQEAFSAGLKDVLESKTVQKVAYNCRSMSDMLYHQYDTILTNVFDIQVAEVMVFASKHRQDLPRYVNSLPICLMENLHLEKSQVFFQRVRAYNKEGDEAVWAHRPATPDMLSALTKNVMHLIPMRRVMVEKMLSDFTCGVDIYLGAVRDGEDGEIHDPERLPVEFYRTERKSKFRQRVFLDNCTGSKDPEIKLNHDGISHGRINPSLRTHKSVLPNYTEC